MGPPKVQVNSNIISDAPKERRKSKTDKEKKRQRKSKPHVPGGELRSSIATQGTSGASIHPGGGAIIVKPRRPSRENSCSSTGSSDDNGDDDETDAPKRLDPSLIHQAHGAHRHNSLKNKSSASHGGAADSSSSLGCRCMLAYNVSTMETDGTCVQWSNSCFAEGEHCKAYKGRYIGGPKNGKPCVVKRLKRQSESKPPNQFLRDIEIAEIAQNLAKEFNALPEVKSGRTVEFTVPILLQVESSSKFGDFSFGDYITAEDFFPGKFEKYVNNAGLLLYSGTLSSFCHFTYHKSKGNLLIVDIQGVMTAGSYLLTDPSLHSKKQCQYGDLDHGMNGIYNFFTTHECTGICRRFNQPRIPGNILEQRKRIIEDKQDDFDRAGQGNAWSHG